MSVSTAVGGSQEQLITNASMGSLGFVIPVPLQNESLELVHISEINKRLTTVIEPWSTVSVTQRLGPGVSGTMAAQVIEDPDIRPSLWPPVKDLRDAGACSQAHRYAQRRIVQ
jgi:hypothetical protein